MLQHVIALLLGGLTFFSASSSAAAVKDPPIVHQRKIIRIALIASDFQECWAIDIIASNASIPGPSILAHHTCGQIFNQKGGAGATSFPSCQWDVVLPEKNLESCVATVESYLVQMFDWANRATYASYVGLPVQIAEEERLFVPESERYLAEDAEAFCAYHAINDDAEGGGEDCASRLTAAAQAIYRDRQSPIPTPDIVLCPHRPPVALPPSSSSSSSPSSSSIPLVAFYHIAALRPQQEKEGPVWAEIVREQLRRLHTSGVYAALDRLEVHVAGSRDAVQKLLLKEGKGDSQRRIHLHPSNQSLSSYEYPTLQALQSYCQANPTSFVLYMHNKGASRTGEEREAVTAWRHYLEHFVLDRYQTCLEVLAQGYDTCGVQFADDVNIYGGNIWWARCDYVAQELPPVSVLPHYMRHLAESFVGLSRYMCPVSCYYHDQSLYQNILLPDHYEHAEGCDGKASLPYWQLHHPSPPIRKIHLIEKREEEIEKEEKAALYTSQTR